MSLIERIEAAEGPEMWRCDACRWAGMLHCSEVESCIETGQMRKVRAKKQPNAG